jgi:hypothetical protein
VLPAAPWYTSEVQVRAVIALGAQLLSIGLRVLSHFGIQLDTDSIDVDGIVADVSQGVAILFAVLAIVKRQQSPVAPLTITAKGAETKTAAAPPLLDRDPTKK